MYTLPGKSQMSRGSFKFFLAFRAHLLPGLELKTFSQTVFSTYIAMSKRAMQFGL